jgi:hypothetical protein
MKLTPETVIDHLRTLEQAASDEYYQMDSDEALALRTWLQEHDADLRVRLEAAERGQNDAEGALREVGRQARDILAENVKLREALEKLTTAIADLADESYGVAGLHRNGDIAPWRSLFKGGQFEEWMLPHHEALAALSQTPLTTAEAARVKALEEVIGRVDRERPLAPLEQEFIRIRQADWARIVALTELKGCFNCGNNAQLDYQCKQCEPPGPGENPGVDAWRSAEEPKEATDV